MLTARRSFECLAITEIEHAQPNVMAIRCIKCCNLHTIGSHGCCAFSEARRVLLNDVYEYRRRHLRKILMSTNVLAGRKILIVEDDYFIAHEMARALENVGAEILGPAPTVEDAKAILGIATPSAAILDVSLPDGLSFPIADNLIAKNTPVMFLSGYDQNIFSEKYHSFIWMIKPVNISYLLRELLLAIDIADSSRSSSILLM